MYVTMFYIVTFDSDTGIIHRMDEVDDPIEVAALGQIAMFSGLDVMTVDEPTFVRVFNNGPENYRVENSKIRYRHSFVLD